MKGKCDELEARGADLRDMMDALETAIKVADDIGDETTGGLLRERLEQLESDYDKTMDMWGILEHGGIDPEDPEPESDWMKWDTHKLRFI